MEVGVIKAFDKKGPHARKFSVKYKDDPNWWTHSLLRESIEVTMTVVKSVSDGLRD